MVINAVWRFIYTVYILCISRCVHGHTQVHKPSTYVALLAAYTYVHIRDIGIDTCYQGAGGSSSILPWSSSSLTPPGRAEGQERAVKGWVTVTDDRCPESNTYTHWTGGQSIVSWKHLRNIPSTQAACAYARATR